MNFVKKSASLIKLKTGDEIANEPFSQLTKPA
jgi:hypothetical protein